MTITLSAMQERSGPLARLLSTLKPFMSPDTRILNLSRNTRLKPHQAAARVAANVSAWVEAGKTIRDLSLREIVAQRAAQARHEANKSLEPSEIFGLRFDGPKNPYVGCLKAAREYAQSCQ